MSVFIELPDKLAERLQAEATRRGQTLADYVLLILEAAVPEPPAVIETPREGTGRPKYLTRLLEIANSFPPEDLARMPADGACEIDHYVYGLPKRGPKMP